MKIYKPSVTTIRVTVSHGDEKVKFTVVESELDELFALVLSEFKELTDRTTGLRIADSVKVHLREVSRTVNMGERTVNVYGVSTDFVAERLVYAVNMSERDGILKMAKCIINKKGI